MTNSDRSVVITGLGCISSLGLDAQQFWDALKAGKPGIGPSEYTAREELNGAPIAEVKGYDPLNYFDSKSLRLLDRATQFALIAADEAIQQAGLDMSSETGSRTGIVIGSSVASRHTNDDVLEQYYKYDKPIPPLTIPKGLYNAPVSHISMRYGITGPSWMVNTACASSNHAIGQAMEMIRSNQADIAIAGGTDTPITVPFFKAWNALRILDPVTCRPFSKGRQGLILGEGAGVVVLEEEQHALNRGAKIFARLAGCGFSADAYDLVKVSPQGASLAIQKALLNANLNSNDIDYINAHGTGTQLNDATETQIIHDVFGAHANNLLVSSTKSMHGHALGASGSFELIATARALEEQCIPPTANFNEPDSGCDLDYVPNKIRHTTIKAAISNTFAFGGLNAVLVATQF